MSSNRYIAAIDQGTASSRCLVFDQQARIVSVGQKEHHQIFPRPGWVEHDPVEIWRNVLEVVREALAKAQLTADDLVALGITNQRETTVVWDRATEPVQNAINWADIRTDHLIRELAATRARTGSATAAACRSRPTSPGPRSAGCSTTCRACASAPRRARRCSGRWTPG